MAQRANRDERAADTCWKVAGTLPPDALTLRPRAAVSPRRAAANDAWLHMRDGERLLFLADVLGVSREQAWDLLLPRKVGRNG